MQKTKQEVVLAFFERQGSRHYSFMSAGCGDRVSCSIQTNKNSNVSNLRSKGWAMTTLLCSLAMKCTSGTGNHRHQQTIAGHMHRVRLQKHPLCSSFLLHVNI